MRIIYFTSLIIFTANFLFGQSTKEAEVLDEGMRLYRSEMASWYGTDLFLSRYSDKRELIGGYFSYIMNDQTVCVFFSTDDDPKIIGTFTFDSTFNTNTAIIDDQERAPTANERDLITIRQIALDEYRTDPFFKSYEGMNPNFIPLIDEKGKRVYVLTGPQNSGVVVLGNDYLLSFDSENKLEKKRQLHKNIIPIEYSDGKQAITTMHTHLPETGDIITATDICTLKLYSKYSGWKQHYVISAKNVSIWDCNKETLLVMTKKAWDNISKLQKKKK